MSAWDVAALLQQGRLLKLDTPLGAGVLLPVRATGRSEVGRQYSFTVDCASSAQDIALKSLIAQPVTLWIQQQDGRYAPHHGYVHTARRLGSDGTTSLYQIRFASWAHFLKFRKDARIWQDKSADEILEDVFGAHPQAAGAFRFALQDTPPKRSFCVQYEDDWTFAHRLMEQEGLYAFITQAQDGSAHTLVVTDNLYSFPVYPENTVRFYRAGLGSESDALTQWGATRTLQSAQLSTASFDYKAASSKGARDKGTNIPTMPNQGSLPGQSEVYEYTGAYTFNEQSRGDALSKIRMEAWESRAKRFEGEGGVRGLDAGQWFTFEDHPVHNAEGPQTREFAVLAAEWYIENNVAVSDANAAGMDFPHSLKGAIDAVRNASQAQSGDAHALGLVSGVGNAMETVASRIGGGGTATSGFYWIRIAAQRRTVPFRSAFDHAKPEMTLQTATVVGPEGQEVYTDALNRIKVQFHWDRLNAGNESASCWVRVAQSDSGVGYGSVHPPRIGEEVVLSWVDGDCDRPLVIGRVYNGSTTPVWHSNGIVSGFRSKEYSGSGYNQLVMDDATGQNRVQLASSSAGTALHLGYLIDHTENARGAYLGSGYDLGSNAHGAVRAAQGLYVSTHPQVAQPMDTSPASAQLARSESVVKGMSDLAAQSTAEPITDGQQALHRFTDATKQAAAGLSTGTDTPSSSNTSKSASASSGAVSTNTAGGGTGSANQLAKPVMLFASPNGIGASTQESMHLSASRQVNVVSGENTVFAIGKSLVASASQKVSLFVGKRGAKVIAAKGKIEVQAQGDEVTVTAQKNVKVQSTTDVVEVGAEKGIFLTAGGAYIRIADGNIEIHAPAAVDVKGSAHDFSGAAQLTYPLPSMPVSQTTAAMQYLYHDDEPVQGAKYVATLSDGSTREGVLDSQGKMQLPNVPAGAIQVSLGPDSRDWNRKDLTHNPGFLAAQPADSDIDALIRKHGGV